MSLLREFRDLDEKGQKVVEEMVANLSTELSRRTPVDTGTLKSAWQMEKNSDGWRFTNPMEYADIIFTGSREVTIKDVTRTIGSMQLPDGVDPILQDYDEELQRRLDKIK